MHNVKLTAAQQRLLEQLDTERYQFPRSPATAAKLEKYKLAESDLMCKESWLSNGQCITRFTLAYRRTELGTEFLQQQKGGK